MKNKQINKQIATDKVSVILMMYKKERLKVLFNLSYILKEATVFQTFSPIMLFYTDL